MASEHTPLVIDKAPGNELITKVAESPTLESLLKFLEVRMPWCGGYPFINDRLLTYSVFDDLFGALNSEKRLALISPTAVYTANAPDRHFHCILHLLSDFIRADQISPRPPELSDLLLRIRLRVERLSFLPNLTADWNSLVNHHRILKHEGDFLDSFTPHQLEVEGDCWKRFFPFPLINYTSDPFSNCKINWDQFERKVQDISTRPNPSKRELIYHTRIENSLYWVWQFPDHSDSALELTVVWVRQPPDGDHEIGHYGFYRQFAHKPTPDFLSRKLLEFEFSPCQPFLKSGDAN